MVIDKEIIGTFLANFDILMIIKLMIKLEVREEGGGEGEGLLYPTILF